MHGLIGEAKHILNWSHLDIFGTINHGGVEYEPGMVLSIHIDDSYQYSILIAYLWWYVYQSVSYIYNIIVDDL